MNARWLLCGVVALAVLPVRGMPGQVPPPQVETYGSGQKGITNIRAILYDAHATIKEKRIALDALTYYGKDAAPVMLDFVQSVENSPVWTKHVTEAMYHVVDRRFIPLLLRIAKTSKDPAVVQNALRALGGYVQNANVVLLYERGPRFIRSISVSCGGGESGEIRTWVEGATIADRIPIGALARAIAADRSACFAVTSMAKSVLQTIAEREERERQALEAPDGQGISGFASPPEVLSDSDH